MFNLALQIADMKWKTCNIYQPDSDAIPHLQLTLTDRTQHWYTMELEEIYQPSTNDKVTDLEKDLRTELADLKSELEENEIIHGISPKFSVRYWNKCYCCFVTLTLI